jgi:hypothetical protein
LFWELLQPPDFAQFQDAPHVNCKLVLWLGSWFLGVALLGGEYVGASNMNAHPFLVAVRMCMTLATTQQQHNAASGMHA